MCSRMCIIVFKDWYNVHMCSRMCIIVFKDWYNVHMCSRMCIGDQGSGIMCICAQGCA
jgi:hypothetical protein